MTLTTSLNPSIGRTLIEGCYGAIKEATHKLTGQKVSIHSNHRAEFRNEDLVTIYKRIGKHPRFLQLLEVIEDGEDAYLVQEHSEHHELFNYIMEKEK